MNDSIREMEDPDHCHYSHQEQVHQPGEGGRAGAQGGGAGAQEQEAAQVRHVTLLHVTRGNVQVDSTHGLDAGQHGQPRQQRGEHREESGGHYEVSGGGV